MTVYLEVVDLMNEIAHLRAENERMRKALEEIANYPSVHRNQAIKIIEGARALRIALE